MKSTTMSTVSRFVNAEKNVNKLFKGFRFLKKISDNRSRDNVWPLTDVSFFGWFLFSLRALRFRQTARTAQIDRGSARLCAATTLHVRILLLLWKKERKKEKERNSVCSYFPSVSFCTLLSSLFYFFIYKIFLQFLSRFHTCAHAIAIQSKQTIVWLSWLRKKLEKKFERDKKQGVWRLG